MNSRQFVVLQWIAAGCPANHWATGDVSYKRISIALQDRGLVTVHGRGRNWSATATEAGRHFLEHREYPPGHRASDATRPKRRDQEGGGEAAPCPATANGASFVDSGVGLTDEQVQRLSTAIERVVVRRPLQLMTVGEVAASLQVSNTFVVEELRRRHLRGSRIGRAWRVDPRDLEVYVEARMNLARIRGRQR